ncbi:MAG TPA: alpha/beta hydrolase family protein [Pyrinomonadaceae bacterium]|nr:alpha/beta hydrolase family protein [Pyrinomonadaceae bacterium]
MPLNISKITHFLRYARLCVPLSLALAMSATALAQAQTQATTARAGQQTQPQSERVETIRFESKLTGKVLPYNVLLPPDYHRAAAKTKRYPVLYLLHGLTGHYTNWLERTRLADYAAAQDLIIVMPEGNNGWYSDSATVAADKYESYFIEELMPDVERRFRTHGARDGRAVAGLSMGGYGALKFGVKHPQLFSLAASTSGAVSAASWRTEDEVKTTPFIRQSLLQTFGAPDHPAKVSNDLFKLVRELPSERLARLPYFYLDCGTEDSLGLLAPNRALADLFVERKIPHEYRQLPGTHNWAYWDRQVREILRLTVERLKPASDTAAK